MFLLEREDAAPVRAQRLAFGETAGRNEAWLRDTLFALPELLPVRDLDPSYGPLVPLCKELRTPAGPIDAAFVNADGRLTLVECKLWRNPEARRKVVAQVLDYARAISGWTYSDLQRQVAAATGISGNVPFELVKSRHPNVSEQRFVDDTARAMRTGRFLLVIAGDGIREDVSGIADLVNRNAASAFAFGLVEVALYGFEDGSVAVQPRAVARTQIIERTVVLVKNIGDEGLVEILDELHTGAVTGDVVAGASGNDLGESTKQAEYRAWWTPVMEAGFDDPDQEPAKLYYPNHVRTPLPWSTKVWLVAYRQGGASGTIGLYVAGREPDYSELIAVLATEKDAICEELPAGSAFKKFETSEGRTFTTVRAASDFATDGERQRWLSSGLNAYVNTFRPRLKRLMLETQGAQS